MRNIRKILPVLTIALVSLCLSTSCMLIGDNYKVRDLIVYIDNNKESDEHFVIAEINDDKVPKSIVINFVNVDSVQEADEIIRLINQYLANHSNYFLNDDYFIEVNMEASNTNSTLNFMCWNSLRYISTGEEEEETTVDLEDNLCFLVIPGTVMDPASYKISSYAGLFSDIRIISLTSNIILDDLSVFGSMNSLEKVELRNANGQISDETLSQLREMYPEIEFIY